MDDETKQWLRSIFEHGEDVPADIVPGAGLTLEGLRDLNAAAETYGTVTHPGDVILDADGVPVGVEESTTEEVYRGAAVIHKNDLDRLGLTIEDAKIFWPKLHYFDPAKGIDHGIDHE